MIEAVLSDYVESLAQSNNPPYDPSFDYDAEFERRRLAATKWARLDPGEKESYNDAIERYFAAEGVANLNSEAANRGKNLAILRREIAAQIDGESPFKLLSVDELHYSSSLIELLENIENGDHIQELYRLRKRTVGTTKNAGINSSEAARIKNSMRQGRELYLSGRAGSLMVKPLNFFYALSAYAYAVIVLNNPIRYSLDHIPGSHGLNYLPDSVRAQFGGDIKQGTFSDLFGAFPTLGVRSRRVAFNQDNEESLLAFHNTRTTVGTGTLLSMVPEIREYYKLVTGTSPRSHPLEITTVSDVRGAKWEFQIGDGEVRPAIIDVENAFPGYTVSERHGKVIVNVPLTESKRIRATIYTDIRGRFWYIENPFFPIILPELCVHFLLTNAFSNIMRYSPDNWGEVLSNQVRTDISLITRKYLSAFENKLPALLLRSLSRFYPYVARES